MERCYCSLVCTFKKVIKNVEVKVDVQKGTLGRRENLTINMLVSFNPSFHPLLSYDNSH